MDQLFVAPKIKVGFQERGDTYTGRLAYVIYYDLKGVLRKEKSWESWRSKQIDPVEFVNEPTEGFVLNKKVGGGRSDWNVRQEYVRVYDPRNFEFEITVSNLLFILRECDCSRGKGLEGKFVYAWEGTTLVLLPVTSEEYKKSANFTALQVKNILAKELIQGAAYMTKKQEKWIYLARRFKYDMVGGYRQTTPVELVYVFVDPDGDFVYQKDVSKLAAVISDTVVPNYAELVETYDKSTVGSPPVRLFTKSPAQKLDPTAYWRAPEWARESSPGVFNTYHSHMGRGTGQIDYVQRVSTFSLQDTPKHKAAGETKYIEVKDAYANAYPHSRLRAYHNSSTMQWVEPEDLSLWVELASGAQFIVRHGTLIAPGDENG